MERRSKEKTLSFQHYTPVKINDSLHPTDPDELDDSTPRAIVATGGKSLNQSAAQEEDISLLLGTMQVPRGRSTSITHQHHPHAPQGTKPFSPKVCNHVSRFEVVSSLVRVGSGRYRQNENSFMKSRFSCGYP